MRTVRIFVSSPGDVEPERRCVERVVSRLNGAFRDQVRLETVRWETSFYSAHETFQTQIPEAADCEVVVAILWSRLGSELPPGFPTMEDGQPFPSGTAYEVLSAIRARQSKDFPDVYVFRKTAQPLFAIDDDQELERARTQWLRLRSFFEQWFISPKGHIRAAFQTFETTDAFEERVEVLLRGWVEEHVLRARSVIWPVKTLGSPFCGLAAFDFASSEVFFGRSRDVARAVDKILAANGRGRPFLLVVGPSGCGKSSLVRAGVASRLTTPGVVDAVDLWRVAIFTPSDRATPFESLAYALFGAANASAGLPELAHSDYANAEDLAALFKSGASAATRPIERALARAAADEQQRQGSMNPLRPALHLVVDQCDDLFAVSLAPADRDAFVALLGRLVETRRVWVTMTLRAALYETFLLDEKLAALKDAGATYDLGFPGPTDLADIVRLPAKAAGLVYERGADGEYLDETILRDAAVPDALPLVQFMLQRLFDERRVEDNRDVMTFAAYRANGGIDGAIDEAARQALAELSEADLAALPRILRQLAGPLRDARSGVAGGSTLAIKAAPLAAIAANDAARRVVDALIDARILLISVEGEAAMARLAHQRVLHSWKRARAIVESQGEFYRIRGEVADQATRWNAGGRRADLLLTSGLALAEAESVLQTYGDELKPDEREFIAVSGRRTRKRQRLTTVAAATFAAVAVASIALGLVAEREATRAEESYLVAREAADGLVVDIAAGLRNVEGMPTASVKRILTTAKSVLDRLAADAPDDPALAASRANLLGQFATNYVALGDLDDALAFARTAVDDAQQVLSRRPEDAALQLLVSNILGLGRVQVNRGDLADARATFDQAMALGAKMSASPSAKPMGDLAQSRAFIGLSDIDVIQGDTAKGLEDARASVAISRVLSASDPANATWKTFLADAIERTGNISGGVVTAFTGPIRLDPALAPILPGIDTKTALVNFEESSTIFRDLSKQDPTNTDLRLRLQNSLIRLGDINLATGDLTAALANHKESLTISSELLAQDAGNTEWKRRVEVQYEKLLNVYFRQQNFAAALVAAHEALDIGKQLSDVDPDNLLWRRDLCADYRYVGLTKRAVGEEVDARENYTLAIAECGETAKRFPSDPALEIDLVYTLYQASRGQSAANAAPLLQEALTILGTLDKARTLPNANANWAPFIYAKLANGAGAAP